MIITSTVDDMMTNYLLVEMDQTGRAGMFLISSIPIERELKQLFVILENYLKLTKMFNYVSFL